MDGLAGVTAIDTRAAGVTARVAEAWMFPEIAEIVTTGTAALSAVAKPAELMVAVGSIDDAVVAQVTEDVRFLVLESVYVPMAVNCCVRPMAMDELAGVTTMEARVAAVTENRVALLVTAPDFAWIVVDPMATDWASPDAAMVATASEDELQVTELVKSWVLLSLYVPIAVNCCARPLAMDVLTGLTAIDTSGAGLTTNVTPNVAVV